MDSKTPVVIDAPEKKKVSEPDELVAIDHPCFTNGPTKSFFYLGNPTQRIMKRYLSEVLKLTETRNQWDFLYVWNSRREMVQVSKCH